MAVEEFSPEFTAFENRHPSVASKTWTFFREWPVIPAAIVALLVFVAIFAPLLAPADPERGSLRDRNVPPAWMEGGSSDHLLGTDPLGRDLLSRLIYGARISLLIAVIVLTGGVVGGTLVGLTAGWFGGLVDEALMRFVDFTFAIPFILVALVVVIVLGQSLVVIILLLVVFSWNSFARQIRGERNRQAERWPIPPVNIVYRNLLGA